MKNEFDSYAESYDENLQDALSILDINAQYFAEYKIKEVYNYCKKQKYSPVNILDFGCGIGNSSVYLSQYFPNAKIQAIDISEKSILLAKERNLKNVDFHVFDGINIDFDREFFDIVFISNVFHHIPHSKHIDLLHSLKAVLNQKGVLFLFEHNTLNPITQKIVKECVFDRDAKLLNFLYTKKIFNAVGLKSKINFILFIPPSLKKLIFLEKYLSWLPLGGQYICIGTR